MGICCSCDSSTTPSSATVKLIHLEGQLQEFSSPIKVTLLLPPPYTNISVPKSFICNADEMDFDEYVSAMSGEEELQRGELYFELPSSWLTRRLEAEDMASLAVKATAALARSSSAARRRRRSTSTGAGSKIRFGCWSTKRVESSEFSCKKEMSNKDVGGGGGGSGKGRLMLGRRRHLGVITEE